MKAKLVAWQSKTHSSMSPTTVRLMTRVDTVRGLSMPATTWNAYAYACAVAVRDGAVTEPETRLSKRRWQ